MDLDNLSSPMSSDISATPTRRTLLALLGIGTLAGGLTSLAQESTEARRKKKGKKKKKRKGGKGGGGNKTCGGSVNGSASSSEEEELLQLINDFRQQNGGLHPLAREAKLDSAAVAHSRDMATRCFFAHENPDGVDSFQRMKNAGYAGIPVAENLYKGSGNLGSAAETVKAWENSEKHRANMLNSDATEIGIGTALDGSGYMIWTNVFGRQRT